MIIDTASRGLLIEQAIRHQGARLTESGAIAVWSGNITGRSPGGKFIVMDDITKNAVDWSNNNQMNQKDWLALETEFLHFEETASKAFYRETGSACTGCNEGLNIEIICELPSHALFVKNMFHDKLENNSLEPLVVKVYPSCMKEPVVAINFSKRMVLISGTRYSGEIKKSVFTYLNFILPASDILTMHCSINCDYNKENVAVFFGLSGTGKTTLSSAPDRLLLGDDEHGWSSTGVFNFEGGCYAKTYGLTGHSEPQIWAACHKFGAILENVTFRDNGYINFLDDSHSKNGRASYPLSFVGGALTGGFIDSQPKTVIMLTCDAFGVLPAMSKLSIEDARKQFLLGYTSKVEGTEHGITSPVATFSPCFGLPFMPRKPEVYADLLVDFLSSSGATCWLVNTGWFGGPQGEGERIPLDVTRAIVGCITDGTMDDVPTFFHEQTGLNIPDVSGVPACFINPELAWSNPIMYNMQVEKLKRLIDEQS